MTNEITINVGDTFEGDVNIFGRMRHKVYRVTKVGPKQVTLVVVIDEGKLNQLTARPMNVTHERAQTMLAGFNRAG